jgi:hypothetical protein
MSIYNYEDEEDESFTDSEYVEVMDQLERDDYAFDSDWNRQHDTREEERGER